jgi:hypothetical protein
MGSKAIMTVYAVAILACGAALILLRRRAQVDARAA